MIGSTRLEVHNSIFNITEHKNKFGIFAVSEVMNGEHIYETVGNTAVQKLGISDITQDLLDDKTIGPFLTE